MCLPAMETAESQMYTELTSEGAGHPHYGNVVFFVASGRKRRLLDGRWQADWMLIPLQQF